MYHYVIRLAYLAGSGTTGGSYLPLLTISVQEDSEDQKTLLTTASIPLSYGIKNNDASSGFIVRLGWINSRAWKILNKPTKNIQSHE